jgi:hypothetical protein
MSIVQVSECAVVGIPSGTFDGTAICGAYVTVSDRLVEPAR